MSGLLPNYILREWDNTGRLLDGGKIFFYQSGTTTPKATYTDFTLSTPHTNPVILDAGGAADIWLGDGAYRVLIQDKNGVQIRSYIDGIIGTGSAATIAPSTNATTGFFKTYNDVRTLITYPDFVYVTGAYAEGDGGAGWFQYIPVSGLVDDDGIVLTASSGSKVYKRVFSGAINPEWYSVKYGINTDNKAAILKALVASAQFNIPVRQTQGVYLTQNLTVPSGAMLECSLNGYFNSGSAVTVTFLTGSKFDSVGVAFGSTVQPVFQKYVSIDSLKLSWFGGATDYDRWVKLAGASIYNYYTAIDVSTYVSQNISTPANLAIDFVGGAILTFTGLANLSIANLMYTGISPIINYTTLAYIGTISLGSAISRLEWFGGVVGSSHALDNSIPFKACVRSGSLQTLAGNYYYVKTTGSSYTVANNFSISGLTGSTLELDQPIVVNTLSIQSATITGLGTLTCGLASVDSSTVTMSIINSSPAYVNTSIMKDITSIVNCVGSSFSNFSGTVTGACSTTDFTLTTTFNILNTVTFSACSFTKSSGPALLAVIAGSGAINFNTCRFGAITDTLFYGVAGTVFLNACTSDTNFAMALSTGLVNVYLNACGTINNSSAYGIDGIVQDATGMIQISQSSARFTASAASVNWRGAGSLTSDGTYILVNGAAVLSSNPYSTSTIRFMGNSDDSTTQLQWLFRLGGVIETTIIYPTGVAPNPASRIVTSCLIPQIQDPVPNVAKIHSNILGSNLPVSMPAVQASTLFYRTNVWGGQVNFNIPSTAGMSYSYTDIYGDFSQTLAANAKVYRVPRIVIYDLAGIGLPIGTKIKVDLVPYLPYSREQYRRFFPKSAWYAYYEPVDPFGGANGSYIQTSLRTTYTMAFTQIKTPYEFRDVDDTGVQVSLSRKQTAGGTWSVVDLPVSSWFGANTINNGFS